MSAEQNELSQLNAAAYRTSHILLDNASTVVAGVVAQIAITGKHLLSVKGNFGTAATVNIYVKRCNDVAFELLRSLDNDAVAQYTKKGDVALAFMQGDKLYAQLSAITGAVSINVNLSFLNR